MDAAVDESSEQTPDLFQPSKGRGWLAALVALGSFFIPQEIPLEWYPLNDPSSGLRYIEITCAANVTGNTQIFLNSGRGINELEKISWPIGPSEMAFTYTFPLADAPLRELRLDPLDKPGEFRITNFRLINRRGEELRRFTKDSFAKRHGIDAIVPTETGWKMVCSGNDGSRAQIDFSHFTFAEGMNIRNLQRCLLSTGYLAMMLWILLLAVFFAFRRPEPWRKTVSSMAFLALLGVLFSFVGNRGLIRNSIRYALTEVPPPSNDLRLELDVNIDRPAEAQLFWDTGHGMSEAESQRADYEAGTGLQTLRFALPAKKIVGLRFDPLDHAGKLTVRRVRVVDGNGDVRTTIDPNAFDAAREIATIDSKDEVVTIETTPTATDPILVVKPAAVEKINAARQSK